MRFFPFFLALLLAGACSFAQTGPATTFARQNDPAAASIEQIMMEHPVAGLSVVAVKNGKPAYTKSFGYKDLEDSTPLSNDDIFRIASISKSFTVTSLMQLIQQKKLSLDDDAGNLIGFPVRNPKYPEQVITLRMLLSHTSSINDSQGYFTLDVIDPKKNENWQKCFSDYAPGAGYKYCNLNFNMAGAILEKISGERFDHYVVNHVLTPLGIYGGYNVDDLDSNRFAHIYDYNRDSMKFIPSPGAYASRDLSNYVLGYSAPIFSPTGGMKISAPGLAKYMTMHMKYGKIDGVRIISKKSERLMRKPVAIQDGYGLALETTDKLIAGETLIGHTGVAYGLFSAMYFEPKKKFGIVVISNGCDPGYTDGYNTVIRKVVNALYRDVIKSTRK